MRDAHLKVIFSRYLDERQKAPVSAVKERFSAFQLNVEGRMPDSLSRHTLRGGFLVSRAADSDDTLQLNGGFMHESHFSMAGKDFSVALIPYPILMQYPERRLIIPEVHDYYKASVMSLATIRPDGRRAPRVPDVDEAEAPHLIELALSHSIGHVMIRPERLPDGGFCADDGCIMGRIGTILDLMRLKRESADFCSSCREAIGDTVRSVQYYAMA
jgi:hypothetical protein